MKKVYLGGKFNKTDEKHLGLAMRLRNDWRSVLLGDAHRLVNAAENVVLNQKYIYCGPFYCEQASNGDFTSTDCTTVVQSEYASVMNCDIFVAVLDENCSPGTVVEIGWALNAKKEIWILYKNQDSKYTIKSEHWFAIADAQMRDKNTRVMTYDTPAQMMRIIKNQILR